MDSCLAFNGTDQASKIVCRCLNITEEQLLQALENGTIRTLPELRRCTGAGTGCNCCHAVLEEYLELHQLNIRIPA